MMSSTGGSNRRGSTERLPWSDGPGGWGGHAHHETEPGRSRTPIVFVHGNRHDADNWRRHASDLRDAGVGGDALWAITFDDPSPSHNAMARELEAFIERVRDCTEAERVDVVAHSLGVTGTRWWMETHERADVVRRFVGIAGANHGIPLATTAACFGITHGPFGPVEELRHDYRYVKGHLLAQLNEPPEVPPSVDCYTIRGQADPLFAGARDSPCLEGAEENVLLPDGHNGAKDSLEARRLIADWLDAPDETLRR